MFKKIKLLWYSFRLKDLCKCLSRVEKCRDRYIAKIDKLSKKIRSIMTDIEVH